VAFGAYLLPAFENCKALKMDNCEIMDNGELIIENGRRRTNVGDAPEFGGTRMRKVSRQGAKTLSTEGILIGPSDYLNVSFGDG